MRRRVDGDARGILLDVDVADALALGVPCSVGVAQDAEGEVIASVEGEIADACQVAEVADGCERGALAESEHPDTLHFAQIAHARQGFAAIERADANARHVGQVTHAHK